MYLKWCILKDYCVKHIHGWLNERPTSYAGHPARNGKGRLVDTDSHVHEPDLRALDQMWDPRRVCSGNWTTSKICGSVWYRKIRSVYARRLNLVINGAVSSGRTVLITALHMFTSRCIWLFDNFEKFHNSGDVIKMAEKSPAISLHFVS